MSYDPVPPFRRDFDAARDPYTARNALGIPEPTGGPPAPASAEYVTASADATLTNERVLTNTATVTWDFSTAGQAKANASGSQPLDATLTALAAYNTNGLLTQTAADTFTGRTLTGPAAGITVSNGNGVAGNPTLALADDLAALEALAGTNTIYYRSGASAWTAVTIAGSMTFSGGSLAAYGGQLPGTTTNDSASSGNVGEYFSGTFTSTVNLVAATVANLMSIANVPAGDYDAWAMANWQPSAATDGEMEIVTSSLGLSGTMLNGYRVWPFVTTGKSHSFEINHRRLSLSATTTIYLVARASANCPVVNGMMALRRRR